MSSAPNPLSLIALAPNPWSGQWVNRQYLLSRLGRLNRVVYSTGAWTVWQRSGDDWRAAAIAGRTITCDNVVVDDPPKFLLRWPRYDAYDRHVVAAHASRLRRIAGWSGAGPRVALLFHPMFVPYIDALRPSLVAYHAYDLFQRTPGWTPALEALERRLLERADLVSTVSHAIAKSLTVPGGRNVSVLPNGVDLELFDAAIETKQEPEDLAQIPRPRFGYVGSLHPQVDLGLVARLASQRTQYQFVLIGGRPELRDERSRRERDQCSALPNVHFLGERARTQVPHYLLNMDANLMIYRRDGGTWVDSGYPLKLHEYLAAGRPVVSAPLETVRPFAHVVRLAEGDEDWLAGLDEAVTRRGVGTLEARRAVARANGWDARAAQFAALLRDAVRAQAVGTQVA